MKNIVANHNKLHYFFIKCEFHLYTVLKYLFSRNILRKKHEVILNKKIKKYV